MYIGLWGRRLYCTATETERLLMVTQVVGTDGCDDYRLMGQKVVQSLKGLWCLHRLRAQKVVRPLKAQKVVQPLKGFYSDRLRAQKAVQLKRVAETGVQY